VQLLHLLVVAVPLQFFSVDLASKPKFHAGFFLQPIIVQTQKELNIFFKLGLLLLRFRFNLGEQLVQLVNAGSEA
jgi:hypothetical protein